MDVSAARQQANEERRRRAQLLAGVAEMEAEFSHIRRGGRPHKQPEAVAAKPATLPVDAKGSGAAPPAQLYDATLDTTSVPLWIADDGESQPMPSSDVPALASPPPQQQQPSPPQPPLSQSEHSRTMADLPPEQLFSSAPPASADGTPARSNSVAAAADVSAHAKPDADALRRRAMQLLSKNGGRMPRRREASESSELRSTRAAEAPASAAPSRAASDQRSTSLLSQGTSLPQQQTQQRPPPRQRRPDTATGQMRRTPSVQSSLDTRAPRRSTSSTGGRARCRSPPQVSEPTAREKQRAAAAKRALCTAREQQRSASQKRTHSLLSKTRERVDAFFESRGIGADEQERRRARQKIVAQRARVAKEDEAKREQAEMLRFEYLQQRQEAEREQYLRGLRERQQKRAATAVVRPPAAEPKAEKQRQKQQQSWGPAHVSRAPRARPEVHIRTYPTSVAVPVEGGRAEPHDAEVTHEDVDRVAVNLFDSTFLSEPEPPSPQCP
eukprot:Rhum_TRINITY_DN20858_c0_g2::Rhum_TRINITY_DN20858_c0_g2_i1::g.172382::m.172382